MDISQENISYTALRRSPIFSKEEVNTLVNLVKRYKYIILNKSVNSTTNHAKEVAWIKICKEFNKGGFKYERNEDSLKTKWENLKREARKCSKSLINKQSSDYSDSVRQIASMLKKTDIVNNRTDNVHQEMNDTEDENISSKISEDDYDKQSDNSEDADECNRWESSRALNFSPQECRLLLKCVREEKNHVFSKEGTSRAIKLKNNAWSRISYVFNKLSPTKRSTQVLRTKFNNMKKRAKSVGFKDYFLRNKNEKLEDHNSKIIKTEPRFINEHEAMETDIDDDEDEDTFNLPTTKNEEEPSDPLSTVLNGVSVVDSASHLRPLTQLNKEVVKLKLELLKYKLENVKLERQRINEMLEAESAERESKAIETSLRLRAARLHALSAELNLPAAHSALNYTAQETLAQQYLQQFI